MHLILLGCFFIWFLEIIILTIIFIRKDPLLSKNRLLLFFGTGIITPIAYTVFAWLTMLLLKLFNLLDKPDLFDTWLILPYSILMFIMFFGTPILTMKLLITFFKREKNI